MPPSIRENFVFNFGRLLALAGLDQKQVSIDLDYSESRISKWMHGVNFPEEKAFDKMRRVYGWTYEQLVRDPTTEAILLSKAEALVVASKIAGDAGYELVKRKNH